MHSVLCEDVQDSIPCHLCFQTRTWNEGHNWGRKRWWRSETEGVYWHVWCVAPVLYCYALLLIAVASFLMWHFVVLGSYPPTNLQGETQKFLDNCYKKQVSSYMDMIYFYSSKYIPPWSINLFPLSFNFFMPAREAVFEMLLSSLVTAHWISSSLWKCCSFKKNFNLGKRK